MKAWTTKLAKLTEEAHRIQKPFILTTVVYAFFSSSHKVCKNTDESCIM